MSWTPLKFCNVGFGFSTLQLVSEHVNLQRLDKLSKNASSRLGSWFSWKRLVARVTLNNLKAVVDKSRDRLHCWPDRGAADSVPLQKDFLIWRFNVINHHLPMPLCPPQTPTSLSLSSPQHECPVHTLFQRLPWMHGGVVFAAWQQLSWWAHTQRW